MLVAALHNYFGREGRCKVRILVRSTFSMCIISGNLYRFRALFKTWLSMG